MTWGCKLIIIHVVVEKEKYEFNETRAVYIYIFF